MTHLASAASHVNDLPPTWRLIIKFAYFVALAAAIGFTWNHLAVVSPALKNRDLSPDDAARLRRRSLRLAAIGPLLVAATAYFQLATRVAGKKATMPFATALQPHRVHKYLTTPAKKGEWVATGQLITAQNVLFVVAALAVIPIVFGFTAHAAKYLIAVAAIAEVGASIAPSIPTKSADFATVMPAILIQAHIIGGSLWVGGLGLLALLATVRSRLSHSAASAWAAIWERFGVMALISVGAVLTSGVWLAYRGVGSFGQFFSTNYGRFLFVKILLVCGLVAAGAFNQLSLMPRIARSLRHGESGSAFNLALRHFPRVVITEIVLGIGVLAIVPFLSGSARAQAAGHEVEEPTFDSRLFTLGLILVVTLAVSFFVTTRASAALGRRPSPSATTASTTSAGGA